MPLGYRSVNKKLEVVPKEAEIVRRIFALYVEVGSVGALARALEEQGIRPKPRQLANGPTVAYGEIKRLFLKAGSTSLEAQLEDEALTLARVAGSADAQEENAAILLHKPSNPTSRRRRRRP